ncbi:hypothetical protein ASE00_09685 [Sphingomonas sp. Root710]|uniref:YkvI family membrane protein n=1 Tax=Sphingomonas sp. Root710 TaxID=1736594 RepID=UPI0007013682|nr:hypothetical protein [Sphingomonas sp. Root710]KRB82336.1 hypothetical protein ASE00_09685 [Sphingomonas sp. Root710]
MQGTGAVQSGSNWFRRFLLPGFAFKAVVIGGGYATGRELVTFFMPSGPWGGLLGMLVSTGVWSLVCALTFLIAVRIGARDYRSFFAYLLGPFWPAFEIAFVLGMTLILAVFAAAAGAIGQALFGWPPIIGALLLAGSITIFATFGNESVEQLFKYVSFFLYGTYAVFLALALTRFSMPIAQAFTAPAQPGWFMGGLTYAGYNAVGAVLILPVMRHLTSSRDAVAAGLLAGPLAMLPAILFFIAMCAFYPQISNETLPSDFLLARLDFPAFRYVFQIMIFAALLESGTGQVHAINERIANAYAKRRGADLSNAHRALLTVGILIGAIFVADRIGLVALIADGYRWLAAVFITVYMIPLLTIGIWRLRRDRHAPHQAVVAP